MQEIYLFSSSHLPWFIFTFELLVVVKCFPPLFEPSNNIDLAKPKSGARIFFPARLNGVGVPAAQLTTHVKSSTLYERPYGVKSKFFRLDWLLNSSLVSYRVKYQVYRNTWSLPTENLSDTWSKSAYGKSSSCRFSFSAVGNTITKATEYVTFGFSFRLLFFFSF